MRANRTVGGVSYTWDNNGNLTSDGLRSYTYDHANRLTQVTEGSLTTQFAYNGDGARTSKTVDSDTTQYVLDLAASLPVVISDTEAVYLYGLDIIAQQQSERLYYMHDGLGSVRQLLDSTGDVETNYAYDPFGVPVVGGDVSNPYQYTGEAWDAEVGLLYLRARYYQPEVGRFVNKDPWPGNVWRPGTLNHYLYVVDNPVNGVDPSGLQEPTRVTPDAQPQWPPRAARGSTSAAEPSPSTVPTPGPQPGSTPTPWDIQTPIVEELATAYGIQVRGPYAYLAGLDWKHSQLRLVRQAASDFADLMHGKATGFRARLAPVRIHRAGEGMDVWGVAGMTYLTHITLSGARGHWDNEPYMKWVVVHELAHWWDRKSGYGLSYEMVATGIWSQAGCRVPGEPGSPGTHRVRDWNPLHPERPNLNPAEDWADSVATYVYWEYAGRVGWQISGSRWSYVGERMDPGKWQNYHDYPEQWEAIPFRRVLVKHGRIVN